jgi:hypothetical protein
MDGHACEGDARRVRVRDNPDGLASMPNGIDHVEVLDAGAGAPRQRTLLVRLLREFAPAALGPHNVDVDGGVRVTGLRVEWALRADQAKATRHEAWMDTAPWMADPAWARRTLVVRLDAHGDFSTYTVRLVRANDDLRPPAWVDDRLAAQEFSFKAGCPGGFDCREDAGCPPAQDPSPPIDYLAKDYASFRRLMLDRLSATVPAWSERNPADLGVTLVEAVAAAADRLSYMQDAAATEAYLATARRRVSVRRHARLLDYAMHDGCNARTVVVFQAAGTGAVEAGTRLLARTPGLPPRIDPGEGAEAFAAAPAVFETMERVVVRAAHNSLPLHAWGEAECCLPAGSRAATLDGDFPDLAAGDLLVLEETVGPETGRPEDADPARRHAVRLTSAATATDPVLARPVTHVAWADEDALPFPLWVRARVPASESDDTLVSRPAAVARGNATLADHGLTRDASTALPVAGHPPAPPALDPPVVPARGDYRPSLPDRDVTQAAPLPAGLPVAAALRQDPRAALPVVRLEAPGEAWSCVRDLLGSGPDATDFVVEAEDDGSARLRFGDGRHGRRPTPLSSLAPRYRTGNGAAGNVGADALAHAVTAVAAVAGVRNPLPASGGTDPEPAEAVRRDAPHAFRVQRRCVTAEDYAEAASAVPGVQKARATLRWTGSWHTVFVAADCQSGAHAGDTRAERLLRGRAEARLLAELETRRLAGVDLEVEPPAFVPIDLALTVCVDPDRPKEDVERDLLDALSNRDLPDGRRGLFHPDLLTFGQTVHLSRIIAAAMAVPGVKHVDASPGRSRFQRWGKAAQGELESGVLALGRLEIARLDNDPSLPENGRIELRMEGGL